MFSKYVMSQLDKDTKFNRDAYLKICYEDLCNYNKTILRYDDNHNLIKDDICERKVYDDIKQTVDNLMPKDKQPSDLEKASLIYKWVSENISYDYDSMKLPSMATQDAFCAFKYRKAVCAGYTCLVQIMMKIADIPCGYISSIANANGNGQNKELNVNIKDYKGNKASHAFNVVYLRGSDEQRTGWTLVDSTWASCELRKANILNNKDKIFETFFPALNKNKTFDRANESLMRVKDHQIKCVKCDGNSSNHSVSFGDDKIFMVTDGATLKLMYIPRGPLIADWESDSESEDEDNVSEKKPKYTMVISNEVSQFKVPIFFCDNKQAFNYAKEVIVEGDVEIDFRESENDILNEIKGKLNFEKSNKYKFDEKDRNKVLDKITDEEVFDFRENS